MMDGKKRCEELRAIRCMIAARNDIEYTPAECNFEGECEGVCPTCEQEAQYIMEELRKREKEGLPILSDGFVEKRIDKMLKQLKKKPKKKKESFSSRYGLHQGIICNSSD